MDCESSRPPSVETVAAAIIDALMKNRSLDAGLDSLLDATSARAAGLWCVAGDQLRQLGFRAVAEMPLEVGTEFAAATREVPLTQTGLGIVKAVVDRAPAIATAAGAAGLGASAGWLSRFACRASLAAPVENAGRVVGVLAISTPGGIEAGTAAHDFLLAVAAQLGEVAGARAE